MRPWIMATAVSVVLLSWALVLQAEERKAVYLWEDHSGKTHLTQEPPQADGFIHPCSGAAAGGSPLWQRGANQGPVE